MIYVASDIHGFLGKYYDFIDSSNFSDDDVFYIIGDVIDRGPDGVRILLDIMQRQNVILIKGNHEHMLLPTLKELAYSDPISQNEIIMTDIAICPIGQRETLTEFCRLSREEQYRVIDYLESLKLYEIISVNDQKYLLVHAGLPDFEEMGELEDMWDMDFFTEEELLFGQHWYEVKHFTDTIVIVGHQPTRFIDGAESDKIYRCGDSINVDCGLGFGGQLGVLCLNTNEELYF